MCNQEYNIIMLETEIYKNVYEANLKLSKSNLVIQNFGNASQRNNEGFVIKPSGVNLDKNSYKDMVGLDFKGTKLYGDLQPSSDEPTHRFIYQNSDYVGGIVHTHSKYATAFAQANKEIINYGTTHSDFSEYNILVTEQLTTEEVQNDYELNTGRKIIEKLNLNNLDFQHTPGILSIRHGVFAWGRDIFEALINAELIEYIAEMAYLTESLSKEAAGIETYVSKKHFNRKHGPDKYYGQ